MKKVIGVIALIVITAVFIIIGTVRKGGSHDEGSRRAGSQRRIAVIPKGTSSIFWESVRAGAKKAGVELGYEISWNGPELESDRERQIQIVEDFIALRVAGIVLAPNDSNALIPKVEEMFAKNIPCVIIDSEINTDKYVSFAATNNYQGGVIAARRMGKILDGKGKVIVVKFMPGSGSTTNRENGFIDTIEKEFPGIEIVDTKYGMATVETALQAAEDLLTKHAELDGLFACNAGTSVGSAQALQSQGRTDGIKMVGFDAEETLIDKLRSGVIDSLVVQDPYKMGYIGVATLVDKIKGKEVPKLIDTGVELVTIERLEEPKIKALLSLQ